MNFQIITGKKSRKKGGYILEATISLPIFLISIIVMCSVILMFACIEDSNFMAAVEMRRICAEAVSRDSSGLIRDELCRDIKGKHTQVNTIAVKDMGYRVKLWGQDELVFFTLKMEMETKNPLNLLSNANYDISLVSRAYVGKIRSNDRMTEEEFMSDSSEIVYIFPKRGEKYHSESCNVLRAASKSTVLTKGLKKKYSSCPICHSRKAQIGSLVYYFPNEGEAYHFPGCACLSRNYIEIEKSVALKRGYDSCSKCGG